MRRRSASDRAQELKRMGLVVEIARNIFQLKPGWRDALKAVELHLDIRKSLMRARGRRPKQRRRHQPCV